MKNYIYVYMTPYNTQILYIQAQNKKQAIKEIYNILPEAPSVYLGNIENQLIEVSSSQIVYTIDNDNYEG